MPRRPSAKILGHAKPAEQLPLASPPPETPPAKVKPRPSPIREPEDAAKIAIPRRAKPSPVPGHVKLTFTVELERGLAERLSARAIREGRNLEAVGGER